MPTSRSSLSTDVAFKFCNPSAKGAEDLTVGDKKTPYYGIIPVSKASRYKELLFCIKNLNTTSNVPIYFKVAKFKLDRIYYDEYVIRERVQEIITKERVKVLAPIEE